MEPILFVVPRTLWGIVRIRSVENTLQRLRDALHLLWANPLTGVLPLGPYDSPCVGRVRPPIQSTSPMSSMQPKEKLLDRRRTHSNPSRKGSASATFLRKVENGLSDWRG